MGKEYFPKELKPYGQQLRQAGFVILPRKVGGGHIKLRHSCGAMVVFPSSAASRTTVLNIKADVKRALKEAAAWQQEHTSPIANG